ncbi:PAS domain S-box protein [Oceanobacillus bengalensis]|uniref:histidine kinase n=2 Tax=Oceanobacillus bengalensis TaxID=1435466 RepID=A0A494Z5Y9_9BACI|nr:PAS domain S-box protein [Oceanobacillus bengalensis]
MLDWIEYNQGEIIIIWNKVGEIVFISNSVERLLGYKKSELLGRYWREFVSLEEEVDYVKTHFDRLVEKKQRFTVTMDHKDGKCMVTECLSEKIYDEQTQEVYYVSSLKDITDRKETEKLLVRSEKMSVAGQLAAGIAHEIRNPLTSIKGFLQLIQAGVNRKEEYYKIMIEEIEKMEKITSELLFISKPLTDMKQLESVDDMVKDVEHLLATQAKLKNIDIVIAEPITASIFCDKSQIKQVLINLMKNAIEAMNEAGFITLHVHDTDAEVEILVCDEGPGIPHEIINKLGEPFFTTKQSGTGLGIMISKQILESHHGRMEIMNNEGKGTTFKLVFPKYYKRKV